MHTSLTVILHFQICVGLTAKQCTVGLIRRLSTENEEYINTSELSHVSPHGVTPLPPFNVFGSSLDPDQIQ